MWRFPVSCCAFPSIQPVPSVVGAWKLVPPSTTIANRPLPDVVAAGHWQFTELAVPLVDPVQNWTRAAEAEADQPATARRTASDNQRAAACFRRTRGAGRCAFLGERLMDWRTDA